jgi:hypothetical protein
VTQKAGGFRDFRVYCRAVDSVEADMAFPTEIVRATGNSGVAAAARALTDRMPSAKENALVGYFGRTLRAAGPVIRDEARPDRDGGRESGDARWDAATHRRSSG